MISSFLKWALLIGIICLAIIGVIYYQISPAGQGSKVDYQVLNIEEAPAVIYEKYEQQKTNRGFSIIPYDQAQYILITMGTVPTAGYSIKVQQVHQQADKLIIKTRFISPNPKDIVAMVISFPTTVVKVSQEFINIQVLADSKPLSQLD